MGKPNQSETVMLDSYLNLAEKLERGEATENEMQAGMGVIIRFIVALQKEGIITEDDFRAKQKACMKAKPWTIAKAVSIYGSVVTICVSVLTVIFKLAG